MNDETLPRPGSNADLSRRVERLEMSHADLHKMVTETNHKMDLVTVEQRHVQELMNTKFSGLEALAQETSHELKELNRFIQAAMTGQPEAQSPLAKQMMEEYREFQREVFNHIQQTNTKQEMYDDYILVQKTKEETKSSLFTRTFGNSVVAGIGGLIGIMTGVIGLAALLGGHIK